MQSLQPYSELACRFVRLLKTAHFGGFRVASEGFELNTTTKPVGGWSVARTQVGKLKPLSLKPLTGVLQNAFSPVTGLKLKT